MAQQANIVVAGAGAVGSTIALVLARAGHRVRVLDPTPPGDNASGVAAGMLAPAFETLFDETVCGRFELLKLARDGWPGLARSIELDLDRRGALAVGAATAVASWAEQLAHVGAAVEMLDAGSLADRSSGHPAGYVGVFTSDDWRIEPRAALGALRRAGLSAGAGYQTRRLEVGGGSSGELLILATGADRALAAMAPELAGLTPVKGHILRAVTAGGPAPVVRGEGVYLCKGSSELVLGASMEVGVEDRNIDSTVVDGLVARAQRLWNGAANLTWRAETGVRAATPDGLPLVGWSARPGVLLAVGARRNGWLLAPLIAETVLGLVEGRPHGRAAVLFDPARPHPAPQISQPG